MRILHVVPYFYPAWAYGGPPRAVYEIAKQQVLLGHEVHVLTTTAFEKAKTLQSGDEDVDGIQVHRVHNMSNWLMWKAHFCTPVGVKRKLLRRKYDVVHLHEVRTLLNIAALLYARCSLFCLSPWGTLSLNSSQVVIKTIFDLLALRLFRQKISLVFAQTTHEKKIASDYKIGCKNALLPLGINIDYGQLPSKKIARIKLGLDQNTFYFLFLGRISPHKGLRELLQAFKKVVAVVPDCRLLIVGRDDGYLGMLEQVISQYNLQSKIIIHGPLYDSDRFFAYRAADSFVFTPTIYEETGTACLEALGSRTPVITTKQASIPFLTRDDGVLEIECTPTSITQAMLDHIKQTPTVNIEKLNVHFSWQNISVQMIKSYEEAYDK